MHANERAEIVLAQEGIEELRIRVLMIHESVACYGALVASSWAWTACSARVTAKIGLLGGSTISSLASFMRQPGRRR